jgi:hypothetical protein
MKVREIVVLVPLLLAGTAEARTPHGSRAVSCGQATLSRPGVGRAYRGAIANEEYAFSARIPRGLTGWDGVDQSAPFHGFTIFLDPQMTTCVTFEVHIQIEPGDTPRPPKSATPVKLGDASAWQSMRSGLVNNSNINNVVTDFSIRRSNHTDEGEILLVAPTEKIGQARRVYDAFVRSMDFRRN